MGRPVAVSRAATPVRATPRAPWKDPYSFQPLVPPQTVLLGWPWGIGFWPLDAAFGPVVAWNLLLLLSIALAAGALVERAALALPYGWIALGLATSTLLAQRSLHAHVAAVADGLTNSLEEGRAAVAKIVGRDVSALDEAGVARAAIESLAENFSDGVVAPALWLAVFGLPGAVAYKAVNTADSMIGHKSARYRAFGWAAARCDDLMNFLPARAAAGLLAAGAVRLGNASPAQALAVARRDAPKHVSPNAGWPEAAAAGALCLELGGTRAYGDGARVQGAILGHGKREATAADVNRALALYRRSAIALWFALAIGALTGRISQIAIF